MKNKINVLWLLIFLLIAIMSLTLILVGCNDNGVDVKEEPSDQSLVGTSWKLFDVVGDDRDWWTFSDWPWPSSHGDKLYTLEFKNDSTFTTNSWVNEFYGTYTVVTRENDVFYKIQTLGGTKVGGPPDLWWDIYPVGEMFTVQENELKLFYNDNQNYLLFVPWQEDKSLVGEWEMLKEGSYDQSLVGTSWKLYSIIGTGFISLVDNLCPSVDCYSLKFKEDGTLRITSSVNESWGTYTVVSDGDKVFYNIYIADFIGTKVDYLTYEDVGLDNGWRRSIFPTIKSFAFQDDNLKLFYNDDQNCLIFKSIP